MTLAQPMANYFFVVSVSLTVCKANGYREGSHRVRGHPTPEM